MIKLIYAILTALPEILELVSRLQKNIEKGKQDRQLKGDIKKINKAFEENDEAALRDIFISK